MAEVPITILEVEGDPDEAGMALWSFAAVDVPGSPAAGDSVNVKRVDIVPGLSFLVFGGDGDADTVEAIAGDSDEEGQLDISVPLAVVAVNPGDTYTGQSYAVTNGSVVLVQIADGGSPAVTPETGSTDSGDVTGDVTGVAPAA